MDALLSIFLTWQFIIFCLGLAAITFILRKIFEYFVLSNPKLPGTKNSLLWRGLLLPIAPVVNGGIAAYFAKEFPYPEDLGSSSYGRVSFGLVAGLLSGLVYRVIVGLLRSKMAQGYSEGYSQANQFNNSMGIISQPVQDVTQNIQVSVNKDPVIPVGMNGEPIVVVSTSQNSLKLEDK
jgi:hypothetical protein